MGLFLQLYNLRWLLGGAILLLYVGNKVWLYHRLKQFRGPFSTGFSEIWHSWAFLSLKSHLKYKDVCDKYGPIARVGPNDLITSSPELLVHMSAVRSAYTRTAWYYGATRTRPGKDHLFSELDEERHTKRRNQMAPGYSGKENPSLESSVDTRVAELVNLIRSKYLSTEHNSKPMDFAQKIQFLTLDVISDIGFGEAFGDLARDEDVNEYIKAGEIGLMIGTVAMATGLSRIFRIAWVGRLVMPGERDKVGYGRMLANARALIEKRLALGTDKRTDMLASFVRHGLGRDELLTESYLQIIAGSDTTATALTGIMLYLITHPRVYARLQAEVDAAAHRGRDLEPWLAAGVIPDSEARRLSYLQAVIKEGIRIHPPVTDQVPKRVPDGGETVVVDGREVFLPGGTNVSYAVWPLHLSKDIFGPDAAEFRPERWLVEKDEAKLALMNRTHELIFGYGKYQCLGKPIALMEIGKTLFELMRNFDWCLAKPETPWKEWNWMGIFTHRDMWTHATERLGRDY